MPENRVVLENDRFRYEIAPNGLNLHFMDKKTGTDFCDRSKGSRVAKVRKDGSDYGASAVSFDGHQMTVGFGAANVSARIAVRTERQYLVFEVLSVEGEGVAQLTFLDVPLTLKGTADEPFAACAMALNLRTNVEKIPGPMGHLWASCHPRFGFAGAQAAVIGCPKSELRATMQQVVSAAPDLPHSPIGGPWALDAPICRGSYLFDFGDVTEQTVDRWIELVKGLGFTQLDFHGGKSFRFGDCFPNPKLFPNGRASLKAVIDRLHDAGISAGLHPYAFFISRDCPWVTPVPDLRLGKDATFTLAEPLDEAESVVPVLESTGRMSAITGFFVRNSVTLHVDDELITYSGLSKEAPYAFTGCKRGACGTKPSSHRAGAQVHHLKECFGLFAPDGDSTLLAEVAGSMAQTFNECGFDMMYLDALDGEDVLGGQENGWHYGSKFVFELWKRLKKPAVMEMSTFHHHLWYVRSRMGAWDHPDRSHKRFIDRHCKVNETCELMFLPPHLGWWSVLTWLGAKKEPTFPDDIEYLCCKAIGTDASLSLMGVKPETMAQLPVLQRLAATMRRYEGLRHSGRVPASVKSRLREPGKDFTLVGDPDRNWAFRPVRYAKHKVEAIDGRSNVWEVVNEFGPQGAQLRIEALMSAKSYDAPENVTLSGFVEPEESSRQMAAPGVDFTLEPAAGKRHVGEVCGRYAASSKRSSREGAWAKVARVFEPPLDLSKLQGLGVWICGDGKGEVLNFQVSSPEHIDWSLGEHYVDIDFTGWRYFELIEPEGERFEEFRWPYGQEYTIFRGAVNYAHVEAISLWYNNLPPGDPVECLLSPVKAIPLIEATLKNPSVSIGGETVVFPVEMTSGMVLEFQAPGDCKLYGPKGELVSEVTPQGNSLMLRPGEHQVTFQCESSSGLSARARVTVATQGKMFRE